MMRMSREWAISAGALAIGLSLAGHGHADVLVVSSSAPGLKPGMQLADSAQIEVPAGAKVRVMLPSGATLSLTGPAARLVKDVTRGEPIVESVWSKAKELLKTGGVDQSRPGATRGAIRSASTVSISGWNVVPSTGGTVCVERGAKLVLARPTVAGQREATVIDTSANARASVVWPDGVAQVDWPDPLKPGSTAVYQIAVTGQQARPLRLKLLDKRDLDDSNALRSLIANECLQQARALAQQ